ncbi:MAG: DUF1730 domain-containing protein [Oscillospiraceae bacterium]|nr:DUF1730 domain-containing protein [Oscillospiraceae bacterium]
MDCALRGTLNRLLPLWGTCESDAGGSVIVAAFPYLLPEKYYDGRNIARYATLPDYHEVCGARLAEVCEALRGRYPSRHFAWYCDNSPLPEVEMAIKAGLGRRGRHNLLITPEYGSWIFLGEIVTDFTLEDSPPRSLPPPPCANCDLCQKACPGGALDGKTFRRERCVSFLSQSNRALTAAEAALLQKAGTAWGCDICQEVCPCNTGRTPKPLPAFLKEVYPRLTLPPPPGRAYTWRGIAVLERNLRIINEGASRAREHAKKGAIL